MNPQEKHQDQLKSMRRHATWLETIDVVIELMIALILFLVVQYFFFSPFIVSGSSMEHTLHDAELIMVHRFGYTGFFSHSPEHLVRGDVVVFRPPNGSSNIFIKRVIGLPGDELQFSKEGLTLNGTLLEEPYTNCKREDSPGNPECTYANVDGAPIVVPEGHVFVMGDNRGNSTDSRFCFSTVSIPSGCTGSAIERFVPYDHVIGKALFVMWPFNAEAATVDGKTILDGFWPIDNPRSIETIAPEDYAAN